jgi:hypothetical protein
LIKENGKLDEFSLMPLHKNLDIVTMDPRDNHNEVEKIRHVSTVESLDMGIKYAIRREMIWRRRLNVLKETIPLYDDPLIISPSNSKLVRTCCLILHRPNG